MESSFSPAILRGKPGSIQWPVDSRDPFRASLQTTSGLTGRAMDDRPTPFDGEKFPPGFFVSISQAEGSKQFGAQHHPKKLISRPRETAEHIAARNTSAA